MVYYFTSNVIDPPATLYVGKDKFESQTFRPSNQAPQADQPAQTKSSSNSAGTAMSGEHHLPTDPKLLELTIKSFPQAHIYLRMNPQQTWDALPPTLVEECAQLTKANSIEGNKKDNVTIIYTPWANLRKDSSMATGQVSFRDPKMVQRLLIPTRINPTINRLEKTRTLLPASDLPAAKEAYLSTQRAEKRRASEKARKEEEKLMRERKEEKEERERGWGELGRVGEGGRSNEDGWDEDDFM